MLKESTMKKYTVKQLVSHLVTKSSSFTWIDFWLYEKRKSKVSDHMNHYFVCEVSTQNKELIKQLIREHT